MPSYAPAQAVWSGKRQLSTLAGPAVAKFSGRAQVAGPNWSGYNLANIQLDALSWDESISVEGRVHPNFQRKYQANIEKTTDLFSAQGGAIVEIQRAFDEIAKANARADAAQRQADATKTDVELQKSYTEPLSILSAASDGTVTIMDHERVYSDDRRVSVAGGALTGFGDGQVVRPYYIDANQEGGAVEYMVATEVMSQSEGRHLLGGVSVPRPSSPPVVGGGEGPPGWINDGELTSQ